MSEEELKAHKCIMTEEILESFRVLHLSQYRAIQRNTVLLCLVLAFLIVNMSVLLNKFVE